MIDLQPFNWQKLFDKQEILDERINAEHKIDGYSVMKERFLALVVEISELANETRCFKYWSYKKANRERMLEELVDCMHFMLSIGNYTGFHDIFTVEKTIVHPTLKGNMTKLFTDWIISVFHFQGHRSKLNYLMIWDYFFTIANRLDFTNSEIYNAYMTKNQINHERQAQGY